MQHSVGIGWLDAFLDCRLLTSLFSFDYFCCINIRKFSFCPVSRGHQNQQRPQVQLPLNFTVLFWIWVFWFIQTTCPGAMIVPLLYLVGCCFPVPRGIALLRVVGVEQQILHHACFVRAVSCMYGTHRGAVS